MTHSLIFFGSDQYSAIVLASLLESNIYHLVSVVTDQKSDPSPVEKLAKKHNLIVLYYPDIPHSLITKDTLGLCASFDHLISAELITSFAGRLYNLHPSLLPQYRNVSPVQYAIALGDQVTGITLFRISPGIDDGEIIAQIEEPILPDDTTVTLTTRLFAKGADLFTQILQGYEPCKLITNKVRNLVFTRRLTRDSGYLEWDVLHALLENQPISPSDTKNELLSLRLGSDLKGSAQTPLSGGRSDPEGIEGTKIIHDLLRALTHWPGVWSLVPTKKANLRISLVPKRSDPTGFVILISGKPNPISLADFTWYYLA